MGKVSYFWRPEDVAASLLSHSPWPSHLWVQLPRICCSSLLHSDHSDHILVWSQARPSCWGLGRRLHQQGGTSGGRFVRGCPECAVAARWGRTWQVSGIKRYKEISLLTTQTIQTQLCSNHWKPWDASELVSYGNRRTHVLNNEGFESRRKKISGSNAREFPACSKTWMSVFVCNFETNTITKPLYSTHTHMCLCTTIVIVWSVYTPRGYISKWSWDKNRGGNVERWYLSVHMWTPGS